MTSVQMPYLHCVNEACLREQKSVAKISQGFKLTLPGLQVQCSLIELNGAAANQCSYPCLKFQMTKMCLPDHFQEKKYNYTDGEQKYFNRTQLYLPSIIPDSCKKKHLSHLLFSFNDFLCFVFIVKSDKELFN